MLIYGDFIDRVVSNLKIIVKFGDFVVGIIMLILIYINVYLVNLKNFDFEMCYLLFFLEVLCV